MNKLDYNTPNIRLYIKKGKSCLDRNMYKERLNDVNKRLGHQDEEGKGLGM
jgi:hypothetical protein